MIDQLIIGDKGSYDDYGASMAKRKMKPPKMKKIRETVPFSNQTYDFSAINGEVYWEERELEYIFEMTAPTAEELEDMKTAFADWVTCIIEEKLHDPFIPDYHFLATYDDMEFEDDEGLDKTTVTVKFTAYPYKISNYVKEFTYTVAGGGTAKVTLVNNSSHRVIPTVKTNGEIAIIKDFTRYAISAGEFTDESFMISKGITQFDIENPLSTAVTVVFSFVEEVM